MDINIKLRAKDIVKAMSIEQKAEMITGEDGGFITSVSEFGIERLTASDGPHGVRIEDGGEANCVAFPCESMMAATWNRGLIEKMGEGLGEDCIEHNIDTILGPGVNIKRTPLCGRNFEYFSEDPILSGEMGAAYIKGVQSVGVATSLKHFACNNQEIDRAVASSEIDERTMREIYLKPFEIAVKKAEPATVMCSYNKINGIYASENKKLLNDILRDEWGYDGMTVSDWGAVHDISKSLEAGMNMQMPRNNNIQEQVKAGLESGKLSKAALDRAAERVVEMALAKKLSDIKYDRDKLHVVAKEVSDEGIVLLRNDDNILPITAKKYKKIAVFGEYAEKPVFGGFGSSQVYPKSEYLDSAIARLKENLGDGVEIEYHPMYETDKLPQKMVFAYLWDFARISASVDAVVMFVGTQRSVESEGIDRRDAYINNYYDMFINSVCKNNKNAVLVMQVGSAVMPSGWDRKVKGLVHMWLAGEAGGSSVADVLTGRVNPSGKLSETFANKARTDLEYPGDGYKVRYRETYEVGYRYYDSHVEDIWFPFGHGLSYTEFEYSNLRVDGKRVSLTVKNVGDCDGKEVVQLYVSDVVSTVSRPKKELRDFVKISLSAGECRTVEFEMDDSWFAYYNIMLGEWTVENGAFEILVGSSSQDIRLKETVFVAGDDRYTVGNYDEQTVN